MSTSTGDKKNDLLKKYVCVIIMIAIATIISNLPPFAQITEYGMKAMGCFAAAIFGWLTVGMSWTGFTMIIVSSIIGIVSMDDILLKGFGNTTTIMVILGMMLFAILAQTQISKKIAGRLLNLKIAQGRPWVFFAILVFTAWIVAFLAAGIVAILIMIPIITAICEECGYERFHKTTTIMYIGVALGAVLGGLTIPVRGMPIYLLAMFKSMYPDVAIPFLNYFIFTTIFTLLILVVFILFTKLCVRVDLSRIKPIDISKFGLDNIKLSKDEKYILIVLFSSIILLMLQPFIKLDIMNLFGSFGFFILGIALLVFASFDGKKITTLQKLADGIQWDIILTVILALQLAAAFSSSDAGVVASVSKIVAPILVKVPPILFTVLILFTCMMLTNFINNGASCIVLFPIILVYCGIQPISIYGIVAGLIICCHLALATPAASVYAQIMFGYTDIIKATDMTKYCFLILIPVTLIAALIGYPLMQLCF